LLGGASTSHLLTRVTSSSRKSALSQFERHFATSTDLHRSTTPALRAISDVL